MSGISKDPQNGKEAAKLGEPINSPHSIHSTTKAKLYHPVVGVDFEMAQTAFDPINRNSKLREAKRFRLMIIGELAAQSSEL